MDSEICTEDVIVLFGATKTLEKADGAATRLALYPRKPCREAASGEEMSLHFPLGDASTGLRKSRKVLCMDRLYSVNHWVHSSGFPGCGRRYSD